MARNQNLLYGKLYQFRLRYTFDDFEKTVWSPISKLPLPIPIVGSDFRYDSSTESVSNEITIQFNTQDPEITIIEIAVREGNDGQWMLLDRIRKYDENFDVLVESNILYEYKFYNDKVLFGLDQADANRLFDYVPQIAECTELINENQLVDAGITEGYDNVDVDATLSVEVVGNPSGYGEPVQPSTTVYSWGIEILFTEIPSGSTTVVEADEWILEQFTSIGEYSAREYRGSEETELDVIASLVWQLQSDGANCLQDGMKIVIYKMFDESILLISRAEIRSLLSSTQHFKTGRLHKFGIIYYDRAFRSGSVNSSEDTEIYIRSLNEMVEFAAIPNSGTFPTARVAYTINNVPPKWAKYWQWVYAKDYSDYVQILVNDIREDPDGNFITIAVNPSIEALNTELTESIIPEWTFEKGDRIRAIGYVNNLGEPLNVIEQIIDVPILSYDEDTKLFRIPFVKFPYSTYFYWLFEVYRKPIEFPDQIGEQYFEIGELNPVLNPYTEQRSHGHVNHSYTNQEVSNAISTLSARGYIDCGNAYVKRRAYPFNGRFRTYPVEANNFDDFYVSDYYNVGRINVVDNNSRRAKLPTSLRWSGSYVTQSRINNLSRGDYDDFDYVTEKYGKITRLKQIGEVLNCRQEYRSTSIYVGRVELRQSELEEMGFIAQSNRLLGTRYVSKEKWGCVNPESEVQNGQVSYYFDWRNGAVIADGYNKPEPISDLGMKKHFSELAQTLTGYARVKVVGGYDSRNDILYYLFTGRTNDDLFSEVVLFKNGWKSFISLKNSLDTPPDCFACIGNHFVSFLGGQLWVHGSGSPNTWYGVYRPVELNLVFNQAGDQNKIFRRVRLNSDSDSWASPDYGDVSIPPTPTFRYGMQTRIPAIRFRDEEGMLYSDIPNNAGTPPSLKGMVNGEPMRGNSLRLRLKNDSAEQFGLLTVSVVEQPT
jgi:hypothetical protein